LLFAIILNYSYKVKLIIPNVATNILAIPPPPSKEQKRKKPHPTNQPHKDCKNQATKPNPTTKATTTKEREQVQETKKTGYPLQENRNPKK
jgi:hypothetical protein